MFRTEQKRSPCSYFIEKFNNTLGYFGDNSDLHGVKHAFSLTPIPLYKRLFWFLILIASGACASWVLLQVLIVYSGNQVSYLIETDYLEFDTAFPAITICEQATSNVNGVKDYLAEHNIPLTQDKFFKEVAFWNPKFCKSCSNCKSNASCLINFEPIVNDIRARCKTMLTDCKWNNKPFNCCDRFLPLATEYGVCFTFNSRLTGNTSTITVNRRTGLPSLVFLAVQEIGLRVHSPDDMVSVGMENILGKPVVLPLITDFELLLKAEETVSDKSITKMPPEGRGCLFRDERPSFVQQWPTDRYTYSNCVLYCRAYAQHQYCNCTHHLMPRMANMPACDIQGLACLFENKDLIGSVSCDCPMGCDEITYKPIHMFVTRHITKDPELVKRGTQAEIRISQLPSSRVRRTAIRGIMGLVVDIGGVGGVFFGASLLSVIEIVYLCCMRRQK